MSVHKYSAIRDISIQVFSHRNDFSKKDRYNDFSKKSQYRKNDVSKKDRYSKNFSSQKSQYKICHLVLLLRLAVFHFGKVRFELRLQVRGFLRKRGRREEKGREEGEERERNGRGKERRMQ